MKSAQGQCPTDRHLVAIDRITPRTHVKHTRYLNTYYILYVMHNLSLKGRTVQAARTQMLYQLPWYTYTCTSQTLSLCVLETVHWSLQANSITSVQRHKSYAFNTCSSLFCLVTWINILTFYLIQHNRSHHYVTLFTKLFIQ